MNLVLALLVIPESLDKARQLEAQEVDTSVLAMQNKSFIKRILAPLAVFAPRRRVVNGRMQQDWSMLWLATSIFLLFLAGVRNSTLLDDIELRI